MIRPGLRFLSPAPPGLLVDQPPPGSAHAFQVVQTPAGDISTHQEEDTVWQRCRPYAFKESRQQSTARGLYGCTYAQVLHGQVTGKALRLAYGVPMGSPVGTAAFTPFLLEPEEAPSIEQSDCRTTTGNPSYIGHERGAQWIRKWSAPTVEAHFMQDLSVSTQDYGGTLDICMDWPESSFSPSLRESVLRDIGPVRGLLEWLMASAVENAIQWFSFPLVSRVSVLKW